MGFSYNPKDAVTLIPDGEYDGEIALADETMSKAGNAMLKLTVKVWTGNGGARTVFDYIVNPSGLWKWKQIASALRLMAEFESGDLQPPDVIGKALRVTVRTKEDKTGQFQPSNIITRYLPSEAAHQAAPSQSTAADDDMPF